jgi:hypothetical protein
VTETRAVVGSGVAVVGIGMVLVVVGAVNVTQLCFFLRGNSGIPAEDAAGVVL